MLRTIWVLTTGGTIASLREPDGKVRAAVHGKDLLKTVEGLGSDWTIQGEELGLEGSYNFDINFLDTLIHRIRALCQDPDTAGIVVTQGTDTMEETAWATYFFNPSAVPVIFTGAQRSAAVSDSDGPRNLRQAVLAASHPAMTGTRSVIVFGGAILSGLWATKRHTQHLQPYGNPDSGPLGQIDDQGLTLMAKDQPVDSAWATLQPIWAHHVLVVPMMLGLTGDWLLEMADHGLQGLVLEAFGIGNANRSVAAAVSELIRRQIPVVVTSRCGAGTVRAVYGNGGGADLVQAGAVMAGYLPSSKARLLLMLLIGNQIAPTQIPEFFAAFQ